MASETKVQQLTQPREGATGERATASTTEKTEKEASEASTQTPTSEHCDPEFSAKGLRLVTSDHSSLALGNIYKMRQSKQLCDITLKIGLDSFAAHKVVLASSSPYFFAMFNAEMKEQQSEEVIMHDMDPNAVDMLIEYAYTGEITITADNVQVLLPASGILQMQEVREACCKFLLRQLHPSNCLGIRNFADTHSCQELHTRSHCYALQNFQRVVGTEEFLLLPFQEVEELISNSQLNISCEEDVFNAVLNWVKHDLPNRNQFISKLMIHVRLPLVNREFLMNRVDNENLIREDSQCRELLLEAMRYHLAPERRCALSTPRTMERKPKGADSYLFAVGGGSLFAIHPECEVYNPRKDTWSPIAPMSWRRSRSGVTGLRRLLYVVGGYDGASDLATAECYNPLVNSWSPITPMGTKRSCLGICSYDGLIYVCGGYDGASCLSSMERFDPLTGVWCSCPAMNTRRRYCRIAVVDLTRGKEFGRLFHPCHRDVAVAALPHSTDISTVLEEMMVQCACQMESYSMLDGTRGNQSHQCTAEGQLMKWVAIDGCIYAIGGNDGSSSLNSVEKYDPKTNKWSLVSNMVNRRSSVGAAMLNCINIEAVLRQPIAPSTPIKAVA